MTDIKPCRTRWNQFPDVILHTTESAVKQHPAYAAAKSGDADAAFALVQDTVSSDAIAALKRLIGSKTPLLSSAHAYEKSGVNAIPEALADVLSKHMGLSADSSIVQVNVVGHTGANGFYRLARQALFDGEVIPNVEYLLVDDFIGQGGTLANLKGYIETHGGRVLGATVLTGKPYSAKLTPNVEQLTALRAKHGKQLEIWWEKRFGHNFDCLTQSEARYLERTADADTIRSRLAAAE